MTKKDSNGMVVIYAIIGLLMQAGVALLVMLLSGDKINSKPVWIALTIATCVVLIINTALVMSSYDAICKNNKDSMISRTILRGIDDECLS